MNGIVSDETKTWATEFSEAVKQLDEQMKLASQAKRQSAIQLTVTNGDQCKSDWKLQAGSRVPEDRVGREVAIEVPAGLYVVRITGEINGKLVQAEKAVTVAAGEIQKVAPILILAPGVAREPHGVTASAGFHTPTG